MLILSQRAEVGGKKKDLSGEMLNRCTGEVSVSADFHVVARVVLMRMCFSPSTSSVFSAFILISKRFFLWGGNLFYAFEYFLTRFAFFVRNH